MLKLLDRTIFPEKSAVLMCAAFDKETDLAPFEPALGEWRIEDGALVGRYRGNNGGILFSKEHFCGDILLDFYASMLPPCENDLNFAFRTDGWNYEKDTVQGFIGGLAGWYDSRAGLEKYPAPLSDACSDRERQLGVMTRALTDFATRSGEEYHIQAGYLIDTAFFFVNGRLVVELRDPAPEETARLGRFGLGVYCSQVRFRALTVYRPYCEKSKNRAYCPNF